MCCCHASSWLQPCGYHLVHQLLEVLAPSECSLIDGPYPAYGCPLPLDPWHHLLESCMAFPAHLPVASYLWMALGWEFGVGYTLISAMAWYLPVVEIARALLLTGARDLGQLDPAEGSKTGVFLRGSSWRWRPWVVNRLRGSGRFLWQSGGCLLPY